MKYQTISLCMIVKDEEKTLERCLLSVKEIVDEIIIVDTGSTDKTLEIARKFTTNIHFFEWNGNFSEARNYATQFATSDYVLSLDADEYLEADSKHLLLEPLTKSYYFLRIRNVIRPGIVDNHSFTRLFRRDIGFIYKGAIHEQINITDFPHLEGEGLSVLIHHEGYNKKIMQEKNKNTRNMKIIEEELNENPTAFGYFNLGTQYKSIAQHEKAVQAYRKSYAINPNTTFAPKMLVFMIQSLYHLKRFPDALHVAKDAALLYPTYTDIRYEIGVVYKKLKYFKDAEISFLKCLELGEVNDYQFSSLEGVGSYLSNAHLAEIYGELGCRDKALHHIVESLRENRLHFASLRVFLELCRNMSNEDLVEQIKVLYKLDSSEEVTLLLQALYLLRHRLFATFAEYAQVKMSSEMKAWIHQMNEEMAMARQMWSMCEGFTEGSQRDLLYFAVVNQDIDFFKQYKNDFNMRIKEKGIFEKIINREKINEAEFSSEGELYFTSLCEDLLKSQKYDVVEYIMTKVHAPALRNQLAKMLFHYNFLELALDCILEPEKTSEKNEVYLLVGDILREMGSHGDAYHYYSKISVKNTSFNVLYRIYRLAAEVGDHEIEEECVKKMSKLSPVSEWAAKQPLANQSQAQYR